MPTPIRQLLSRTVYDTDGSTTEWEFSFSGGYLDRAHVKAQVEKSDGTISAITVTPAMFTNDFTLRIEPALVAGQELVIYRDTPKTLPLVDFTDEGNLTEVALDTNAKQAVFIAAETADSVGTVNAGDLFQAADDATQAAADAQAAAAQATSILNLVAGSNVVIRLSGTGSITSFPIAVPIGNVSDSVYIGGIYQNKDTYSLTSTALTFNEPPPQGSGNIELRLAIAQPLDALTPLAAAAAASAASAEASAATAQLAADVVTAQTGPLLSHISNTNNPHNTTAAQVTFAPGVVTALTVQSAIEEVANSRVRGPASSTDNTIPRFDGTTGKLLQGSGVVVDDSGNLGVGVTPSAWSGVNVIQFPSGYAYGGGVLRNEYFDGTTSRYIANGFASKYQTFSGTHVWYTAPSGTAGNPITYTTAMTLDASGNLGVGRSPNYKVDAYLPGTGSPAVASSNDSMVTVMQSVGSTQANIGTLTSHPVVFIAANTERMRLDTSGNLDVTGQVFGGTARGITRGFVLPDWRMYNGTSGNTLVFNNGSDRMTLDNSGNLTLSSGTLGYGAGAGGTVTQATSKTTGVTLNKPNGKITLHNAALAAGAQVEFVFTNSFIALGDKVFVQMDDASIGFKYRAACYFSGSGTCYIQVTNTTGGSLSEAPVIGFAVIKGSTT